MAIGAWQDMFQLTRLEERPVYNGGNQQILYKDEMNEIVMTEAVSYSAL
jgi:hypothetical protein